MITFKQYLAEARAAPLYHGTTMTNLYDILRENVLRAGFTHGGMSKTRTGKAISLTRSLDTAKRWSKGRSWADSDTAVIVLDQQKLTHKYKIKPIEIENIWAMEYSNRIKNAKASELFEEYIDTDIKNIKNYITGFYIESSRSIVSIDNNDFIRYHPNLNFNGKWVNR